MKLFYPKYAPGEDVFVVLGTDRATYTTIQSVEWQEDRWVYFLTGQSGSFSEESLYYSGIHCAGLKFEIPV